MRKRLSPRYLLPMIIIVGVLVVFLRVSDVWEAFSTGKLSAHSALAEGATPAPASDSSAKTTSSLATKDVPPAVPAIAVPAMSADTPHYSADDLDQSPAEMEVLKQLSHRREELDKRAQDLDTREELIKVAEQRVDQKIKEMTTLRQQLQSMVNQVNETQAAQIENLVKIYETMKPEEAARIFETLDMPILLGVVQRMKPARTAPVLAKMTPEKAKELTVALTKQDQLPQLK